MTWWMWLLIIIVIVGLLVYGGKAIMVLIELIAEAVG